jgi:hypothetical protein
MPACNYTLAELTSQHARASRNITTACCNSETWVHRSTKYQCELATADTIPMMLRAYQRHYNAGVRIKFWAREAMRAHRGLKRVER